jgi:flagellar biosynthesis/type III secretory pathway M-ring protein FliF/YscJ
MNPDPGLLGPPSAQKKPDDVLSLETLKKKPALLWGSVGGVVLVIGLIVFAVVKMMRGGNRGATVQEALPVVDTYAGLPSGSAGAMGEPSRLPALMPSRTEVLLTQLQENSRNNPEAWANILRTWLGEEEPT